VHAARATCCHLLPRDGPTLDCGAFSAPFCFVTLLLLTRCLMKRPSVEKERNIEGHILMNLRLPAFHFRSIVDSVWHYSRRSESGNKSRMLGSMKGPQVTIFFHPPRGYFDQWHHFRHTSRLVSSIFHRFFYIARGQSKRDERGEARGEESGYERGEERGKRREEKREEIKGER
jgi:hypothetical protein